jgi:trk system potassium uptake protein TrkH
MKEKLATAGAVLMRFAFGGSAARTAVASFACAIAVGALLLTLPVSSAAGHWTSPVDAAFTATSGVCVTGLLVKSTPDHWSLFGQLVILTLIQVGGLGIMTMGAFVAIMLQRRLSMRFEAVMTDLVEPRAVESVWTLVRFVCLFTLVAEVLGALSLFFSWRQDFADFWPCFYHSVFHSISAFCNAGFSLNNDSLVRWVDSVPVNAVVCLLIIFGGIGFTVVRDLKRSLMWWLFSRRGRRAQLGTHSRLVLTVTGVLLVIGFAGVFAIESFGSLRGAPLKTRVLAAVFQSVTPRTAGFNTVRMGGGALAPATAFLLMALMYVGGSPGSTAGGIKTSTLGVMIASIVATLKGRSKAELFHHSVSEETVHRVASIILLSVGALAAGIFLLLITEKATFRQITFDAISAFGTVGLSTGLTGAGTTMSAPGKLVITALMFVGRLGPVTLVLSVAPLRERAVYRYPEGQVLVG